MITLYYEFDCETCHYGDHPTGKTKRTAIEDYREEGGIVTADGKTYCSKRCYEKRNIK